MEFSVALEPVYMPKFGMTMTEGLIVAWHCQEGERIEEGAPLLTVETEKVDSEINAPAGGTLVDVRYQVDDEVSVGEIIAHIDTGG